MADISTYLYVIAEAERGSEMRSAIHDALATLDGNIKVAEGGAPTIVTLASEMTDETKIYLYMGSETGYTAGDWYYYDGTDFVSGGPYGGAGTVIDDDGEGHVTIFTAGGQS